MLGKRVSGLAIEEVLICASSTIILVMELMNGRLLSSLIFLVILHATLLDFLKIAFLTDKNARILFVYGRL